jgi:hypothetical protein
MPSEDSAGLNWIVPEPPLGGCVTANVKKAPFDVMEALEPSDTNGQAEQGDAPIKSTTRPVISQRSFFMSLSFTKSTFLGT